MENMRFKVGDRVRIKSLDWYNENKDEYGYVRCIDFLFTPEHAKYCGCEFTISHITEFRIPSYVMENNGHEWTDEMIECKVEEETKNWVDISIPDGPYTITYDSPSMNDSMSKNMTYNEIILPEGCVFKDENGNEILTSKIILEKKKKEYPKTFYHCVRTLGLYSHPADASKYKTELIHKLQTLLVCRDAYWKIAGDEMGLGKPWEPDLLDDIQPKFVLANWDDNIEKRDYSTNRNYILTFPTAEMRDAFYENFKKEIEICKKLL